MELFPNYLALKAHIGFLPCVVYGSLTSQRHGGDAEFWRAVLVGDLGNDDIASLCGLLESVDKTHSQTSGRGGGQRPIHTAKAVLELLQLPEFERLTL